MYANAANLQLFEEALVQAEQGDRTATFRLCSGAQSNELSAYSFVDDESFTPLELVLLRCIERTALALVRAHGRPLRVLDVGAGSGRACLWLQRSAAAAASALELVAVDVSPALCDMMRRRGVRADIRCGDAFENAAALDDSNSFDCVLLLNDTIGAAGRQARLIEWLRVVRRRWLRADAALGVLFDCQDPSRAEEAGRLYQSGDGGGGGDGDGDGDGSELLVHLERGARRSATFYWLYLPEHALRASICAATHFTLDTLARQDMNYVALLRCMHE